MRLVTPPIRRCSLWLCVPLLLVGCASSGSGSGLVDSSLEALGIRQPTMPDASTLSSVSLPKLNKQVTLRIHAGEQLNTDPAGRSLSVVVRVYKLKELNTFALAPYDAFRTPESERAAFGSDVVEMRELVLKPGQKYETVETMPTNASYLAVVGLFRAPASSRWRFVFDAKQSERSGVTVGVHDCALSVAAGQAVGASPESLRLAGMRCG